MTSTNDAIENILLLARRVKTLEGARLYNKPIGSIIDAPVESNDKGQDPVGPRKPSMPKNATPETTGGPSSVSKFKDAPVSLERLKSLQRQLKQAAKMDDISQVKKIQSELSKGITAYGKDRPAAQVINDLSTRTGRK